jgi:ABC-type transport system involved in multi-copper enzyme maturation permease subunit
MRQIKSLIKNIIFQAARGKILWIVLITSAFVSLSFFYLPATNKTDLIKLVITLFMSLALITGVLMPLLMAANILPDHIKKKVIYSDLTKPVRRHIFILGKIIGYGILSGIIMIIVSFFALITLNLLITLNPTIDTENFKVKNLTKANKFLLPVKDKRYLSDKKEKASWYFYNISPLSNRLHFWIRLNISSKTMGIDATEILIGLKNIKTNDFQQQKIKFKNGERKKIIFSTKKDGFTDFELTIQPHNNKFLIIPSDKSVNYIFAHTNFNQNFLKAVFLLWLEAILAISIAVMGSVWLSGPVSISLSLFLWSMGHILGFIRETARLLKTTGKTVTPHMHGHYIAYKPTSLDKITANLLKNFCDIYPDFKIYEKSNLLLEGINIKISEIINIRIFGKTFQINNILYTLIYASIFYILAWIIFRKRELY